MKVNSNCENLNLSRFSKKYNEQTEGQLKEIVSIYRQHTQQPKYGKIEFKRHKPTCGQRIFKIFSFLKIQQNRNLGSLLGSFP